MRDETITAFLDQLAARVPAPGGGATAALHAAQSAALLAMVARYSDAAKYVDAIPRVEPEAVSATLEFMGKKGLPIETFADNSIIDRLVREGFIDQVYKKR